MDDDPLEYDCFECGKIVHLEAENTHIEPHSRPLDPGGLGGRCPASWTMVPPPNMSDPATRWIEQNAAALRLDDAIRLHDGEPPVNEVDPEPVNMLPFP